MPSRDNERKKRWGLNFSYIYTVKTFGFGGHCVNSETQAHADLSNMAAAASGCTVCEGCFHSTATTPFLAGSLSHYSSRDWILHENLHSALLFAPQVSIKKKRKKVAKQTMC